MVVLIELFGYILLEYLLIIPGGLTRWAFLKLTRKNHSLEYCFKHKVIVNYGISLGVMVVIGIINIFS